MAKWRALHGSISTSEELAGLTEFEQLLFTWMIPHADDWGILTGTPLGIKMKVIPGTTRSLDEIDEALTHLDEVGLIWHYKAEGHGQLVQLRKWDGYQPIRRDRRAVAEHPGYDGAMPTNCQPDDNQMTTSGCQPDTLDYTILDKTIPDEIEGKEKSLAKHWACQCYRHVVHKHIKTALRDGWIAFAERNYTRQEEDANFEGLKADIKAFMGKGWYEGNIDWFMEWVEAGKLPKWEGKSHGKSRRGLGADDDPEGFNADAARLQAEREARADADHA